MKNTLQLLRPQQWLKNIFVFLPLFFNHQLLNNTKLTEALVVFIAFSFISSSIYCFNDILDIEEDKKHPTKRHRPLASGSVSKAQAYIIMLILAFSAFSIPLLCFNKEKYIQISFLLLLYFAMNIAYCIKLKHIAIIDVFIISIGFVMRVISGGAATEIWVSQWIILLTLLLALFLAFAKRRDDVLIFNSSKIKARKNIARYNLDFLNNAISIIASMTMICYIMWCVSEEVIQRMGTDRLYITSIFVLMGILRYLQATMVDAKSGSPTKILYKDHFIHICIAGWIITFYIILYL